jgi:carbonic anhydrase
MMPPMGGTEELLARTGGLVPRELSDVPASPSLRLAVVACMDARLVLASLLGLRPGDAHVIRNAGGVVGDEEIRSLAISQHELGTREVIVLAHTGCGLLTFTDEEFARRLERVAGERPPFPARAFTDVDESVRASLRAVAESRFLLHRDAVRGFVADLEEGRLREVFLSR